MGSMGQVGGAMMQGRQGAQSGMGGKGGRGPKVPKQMRQAHRQAQKRANKAQGRGQGGQQGLGPEMAAFMQRGGGPQVPSFMQRGSGLMGGMPNRPSDYGPQQTAPNSLEELMAMARGGGQRGLGGGRGDQSSFSDIWGSIKDPKPKRAPAPQPSVNPEQFSALNRALRNTEQGFMSGGDGGHAFTKSYQMPQYNRDVRDDRWG